MSIAIDCAISLTAFTAFILDLGQHISIPVALGTLTSFLVVMTLLGLTVIISLEKLRVLGGILLVIIAISIIVLIVDQEVKYQGLFAMPCLVDAQGNSLIFGLDIMWLHCICSCCRACRR